MSANWTFASWSSHRDLKCRRGNSWDRADGVCDGGRLAVAGTDAAQNVQGKTRQAATRSARLLGGACTCSLSLFFNDERKEVNS